MIEAEQILWGRIYADEWQRYGIRYDSGEYGRALCAGEADLAVKMLRERTRNEAVNRVADHQTQTMQVVVAVWPDGSKDALIVTPGEPLPAGFSHAVLSSFFLDVRLP